MSWDAIKGINDYFGNSIMFLVFIVSLLYCIKRVGLDQEQKKILLYYLCLITIVIFPVTGNLMGRLVGKGVMWRVGWLLIVPFFSAYSFTHWVYDREKVRWINVLCAIGILLGMWAGKDYLFTKHTFDYERNVYKISDTSIEVADYLVEENEYYVLATPELASQLRQYEPNIRLLSGRWPNYEDQYSASVFSILTAEVVDTKILIRICKKKNCETVILKDEILSDSMESLGASLMKEIGGYKIYRIVI